MNVAIILAGGKGERLENFTIPKQYIEVGDKKIIDYCIDVFKVSNKIDIICIVADLKWRNQIGDFIFAEPGISRQHSIYNGLIAMQSYKPNRVIIHDSARPIVTVEDIARNLDESEEYDGGTPVVPVTETIYRSDDKDKITSILNRDELFIGQTPECYDFEKYLEAHKLFVDKLGEFRGSSEIAVEAGMRIKISKGNPNNFKITTKIELEKFKSIVDGEYYESMDFK